MAWHDEPPWAAKKRQRDALAKRRERALEIVKALSAGELEADKALDQIVDVWTGDADPVVRIGNQHKPEIET